MTDAVAMLDRYLALMAERELVAAAECLAPDAILIFPPNQRFTTLAELVASARTRYRWCDKVRDRWDVCSRDDGATVIYSLGTLFGENTHGVPFEGIRYVDRFVLRDGKIVEQEVWNDLDASGVLDRTPALAVTA